MRYYEPSYDASDRCEIYAEFLSHIRKLSLHIIPPGWYEGPMKITVLGVGDEIEVCLTDADGHPADKAKLPAKVKVVDNVITNPAVKGEWTLRLAVDSDEKITLSEHVVPWTASSLTAETEICCFSCQSVFVDRGTIKQWKDLPSESWAEMMEFWHCHKPDEPEEALYDISGKGYAAAGRLQITPGVGFVDASYIYVPSSNATANNLTNALDEISCSGCSTKHGQVQESGQLYSLCKSLLAVSTSEGAQHVIETQSYWLACRLLQAIDDYGVRRFVLNSRTRSNGAVSIWVFAPDLLISTRSQGIQHVVKIMWKDITAEEADALDSSLGSQSSASETLFMSTTEFWRMRQCLKETREYFALPKTLQTFQDWDVALLPRYNQDTSLTNNFSTPMPKPLTT